jgi:drug/metabolite transporter (DMT)-like permease
LVDRRSLLLLVSLAALWGASYLFIKIGLDGGLSPETIVFVRAALAALALTPIALSRNGFAGLRPLAGWLAVLAVIEVVAPFLLISFGEQWITSSLTGVLVASLPIWTALLAPWLDRAEAPTRRAFAGIVLGIVGVGLILGVDLGGGGKALLGGVMVVLAPLGYAIAGFIIRRRLGGADTVGAVAAMMAMAALIALPIAAFSAPSSVPDAGPIAAMIVLGAGGTGIAFIIFYELVARVGPARAALVTYLAPGFAVFYGVALYGEALTVGAIAGLVLIVGGSWLAGRARDAKPAAPRGRDRRHRALGRA